MKSKIEDNNQERIQEPSSYYNPKFAVDIGYQLAGVDIEVIPKLKKKYKKRFDEIEFYSASEGSRQLGKNRSCISIAIISDKNIIYNNKKYKPEYII